MKIAVQQTKNYAINTALIFSLGFIKQFGDYKIKSPYQLRQIILQFLTFSGV